MAEETMTMNDLAQEVDASFQTFKDEGQDGWEKVKKYLEEKTVLTVTIDGVVNKGVISNVEGVRGFIPGSRLALGRVANLEDYLGKEIQVRVHDVDEEKNRLILSAREILREQADAEKKAQIAAVEVGAVLDGEVESLQPYGAFVSLGNGISGLVHISQISNTRIKKPEDVLTVGDAVQVKVIAIKDGKLSLSIKALQEDVAAKEEEEIKNIKLPKAEAISTSLGDLLKGIKL